MNTINLYFINRFHRLKYISLFILFINLIPQITYTQIEDNNSSNAIQATLQYGTIFKHSPAYRPTITEQSFGIELGYNFRPIIGSTFFEKFNYPSIQIKTIYNQYGDDSVFGNSVGATTSLQFYLIEKSRFSLQTSIGLGLGYVSKTYTESWHNNVIGSHLNICAQLSIAAPILLTQRLALTPQVGITHYSNGHITLPNLGINFIHADLGLQYYIRNNYTKSTFVNNQKSFSQYKNCLNLGIGLSDRGTLDQHHILPTYSINYNRRFYTSSFNALVAGASLEYKNDDYDYKLWGWKENTDLALVVGDELILGRFYVGGLIGAYLHTYSTSKYRFYQRISANYTLPIDIKGMELALGFQLKVHYGNAELTELRLISRF